MTSPVPDQIQKHVVLRAPLPRVWRALTDSREFGSWFGVEFDGPFKAGERLAGKIRPTKVDPAVAEMQKPYDGMDFIIFVERIEPQTLFSFRWHPGAVDPKLDIDKEPTTLVVFTLQEAGGAVTLTVTESGFHGIPLARRAEAFTMNEGGWAAQMTLIEKYLAQAA